MSKPSIPQGTRDFSPEVVRRRQSIFNILRTTFETYGYQPIETPAMEQLQTLMGKYGDEGDRLIFKILNNGLHEGNDSKKEKALEAFQTILQKSIAMPTLTERALRYDLTIPFARYVVMHQQDIAFPFKRYQMQPVWRADRPQRGRYREFWQCDCDVVGSNALLHEGELLCIYAQAFYLLNIPEVTIHINSRKLLSALATYCGYPDQMIGITVAIDKLDKIGWDGVTNELRNLSISDDGIAKIKEVLSITGSNEEQLNALGAILGNDEEAAKGIDELRQSLSFYNALKDERWTASVKINTTLARGLNYYTGVIFEVTTSAVKMGSIGGGGRYDDLTGLFGLNGISGVGISFGIDRIYDVMEELNLFREQEQHHKETLIIMMLPEAIDQALALLKKCRSLGMKIELYADKAKADKQMKYANKRGYSYVAILGEQEVKDHSVTVKDLNSGEQRTVPQSDIVEYLK